MRGLEVHPGPVASGKPIPTVLITARPDERVRARALKAGIICEPTRPFREDDPLDRIRLALAHGKKDGNGP